MKPTRLIKEFRSQKLEVPLICIVRDDPRRLQILDEIELGIYGWYEPENSPID